MLRKMVAPPGLNFKIITKRPLSDVYDGREITLADRKPESSIGYCCMMTRVYTTTTSVQFFMISCQICAAANWPSEQCAFLCGKFCTVCVCICGMTLYRLRDADKAALAIFLPHVTRARCRSPQSIELSWLSSSNSSIILSCFPCSYQSFDWRGSIDFHYNRCCFETKTR